jgi:phosphoglycolate phosphatase
VKSDRVIIFDFDGTLCATHEGITHCMQRTFATFDEPAPSTDEILKTIRAGIGLEETLRVLNSSLGQGGTNVITEWVRTYRTIYNSGEGQSRTFLFDGVIEAFEEVVRSGSSVVIVSNKGEVAVASALHRFGLAPYVSVTVCDRPNTPKKPDPDLFKLRIAPSFPEVCIDDILVVGDTKVDILFARNIGARCCWAAYGYGEPGECIALKPDLIVQTPREMMLLLRDDTRLDALRKRADGESLSKILKD